MMIAIMLFNPSFYYDPISSMSFGIMIFNDFSSILDPNLILAFNIYVDEHQVKTIIINLECFKSYYLFKSC